MITRRVRGREFRLRPSKLTNQIVLYVVAVAAQRLNIQLHAIVVMSNHWHICLHDPDGRICEFTRDCHATIARVINNAYGDFENLWSSQQTNHVHCAQPGDLVKRIAYTMANPVEARLVRYGHHWPGVRAAWPAKPKVVKRPWMFFREEDKGGAWPKEVTFELTRPKGYDELSDDELAALIRGAIDEREDAARKAADREGARFLGRRAVLAQSRYATPVSPARRSGLSPRVACKNKWLRIERLQQSIDWLHAYRRAWKAWAQGDHDVEFPHGTYQMRVLYGVRCAPPPT